MNYFETLNAIDVNGFTEKKNGLTYLSWAHAWKELKKIYPKSYYTVYQNDLEWNYFTDNKTCWVKTGVTVVTNDEPALCIEHIEYLPVMDFRNKSIPFEQVTSFDVNKAIQRSLTKAVARHGMGLYIYAGEDLPDSSDQSVEERQKDAEKLNKKLTAVQKKTLTQLIEESGSHIADVLAFYKVDTIDDMTAAMYGDALIKLKAKKDKK
jgi:hypothetical protein